jgi:signal transduction histidine kinase
MKPRRAHAKDLPWLTPSAQSLRALARARLADIWSECRTDPGLVFLVARACRRSAGIGSASCDVRVLRESLHHLQSAADAGLVDWNRAGCRVVYATAHTCAQLAAGLAERIGGCDREHAWMAGWTTQLGWLAACATDPLMVEKTLTGHAEAGFDAAGLARRISNAWRLPAWLSTVAGHLALPVDFAERLGADRRLFQIVQLAVLLGQCGGTGPRLAVGAETSDLLAALHVSHGQAEAIIASIGQEPPPQLPSDSPATQPLLIDLLQIGLRDRARRERAQLERLHRDMDRVQETLARQRRDANGRLQALKLAALAEFAAGAGHEINNPLAVISGQAQYLLKQLDVLDGPAEEIDDPAEYLANLRRELAPSLAKIIGQTQRIHGILTDLMQFARPVTPRLQHVDAGDIIDETRQALQALADERQVRLVADGAGPPTAIHADPAQVRAALTALVRNAIEAAPPGGWASIRLECDHGNGDGNGVALVVEDNGPGPGPLAQEHLFDPFFSGRIAGRGRGLGLPTAWRLACQQRGDLRFDGTHDGVTRFRLVLPTTSSAVPVYANGCNGAAHHE